MIVSCQPDFGNYRSFCLIMSIINDCNKYISPIPAVILDHQTHTKKQTHITGSIRIVGGDAEILKFCIEYSYTNYLQSFLSCYSAFYRTLTTISIQSRNQQQAENPRRLYMKVRRKFPVPASLPSAVPFSIQLHAPRYPSQFAPNAA